MYGDVELFVDGRWTKSQSGAALSVINPATSEEIGTVAKAEREDLDRVLEAAEQGFIAWRLVSAFEPSKHFAQS